ncbi:MAG: glycosyltransferase [bacterium]
MIKKSNKISISVIIPVYNDYENLKNCIEALNKQTKLPYEIIIVDNNSNLDEKKIIKKLCLNGDRLVYIEENEIQGSYAARNKGLEYSKGKIIAFTDSDCTPEKDWIKNIRQIFLKDSSIDALAGKVKFIFKDNNDSAEIIDSLVNMQNEECVKNRGVAKTANLSVKKEMFDKIGKFDIHLKSGGDVSWTKRLTSEGYKLIYDKNVIVKHPTRKKNELLNKVKRVAKGKSNTSNSYIDVIIYTIKNILPPNLKIIKKARKRYNLSIFKLLNIYLYLWGLKLYSIKYFYNKEV